MKNYGTQFCLGAWASMAVGFGILSRSWETFTSLMMVFAFFAVSFTAMAAMQSKRRPVNLAGTVVSVLITSVFVGGLLSGAERVYLANGNSYPSFLASADLGAVDGEANLIFVGGSANGGRGVLVDGQPVCKGQGAELFHKDGGLVVIRCGGLMWYDSHTYLAHEGGKR